MCGAKSDVRFTPNSDHESGHHKPFALKILSRSVAPVTPSDLGYGRERDHRCERARTSAHDGQSRDVRAFENKAKIEFLTGASSL